MHIVFLVHKLPINNGLFAGGAGNYVLNMAKILAQKGNSVDIVTEGEEKSFKNFEGINVYTIKIPDSTRGGRLSTRKKLIKNLKRSYLYNKQVKKIDTKDKVDIVQCVSTYGIGLMRRHNIPYLLRASDYLPFWDRAVEEDFDYYKHNNYCRLDERPSLMAVKRADKVIVPSIFLQGVFKEKLGIMSEVIESPILLDRERKYAFNEVFEKEKYFLTYGAINRRKELHILIPIMDQILDDYPDMKFVLVGKGLGIRENWQYTPIEEYIRRYVKIHADRFIYLGEIRDRERLFGLIQNSKICVLPTRMDNLPNTVLEAMALGKVIVSSTSDYGTSVEQLITDGQNGFLAQIDDEKSLMDKIDEAMNLSEADRQKIGDNAKERVSDLTPEKVYEKMMGIYCETIEAFREKR